MTAPTETKTLTDRLQAIEGDLHDVRYLVAMVAEIVAVFDDHDSIKAARLRNMLPGLRFVVGKIEADISTAIDALDRAQLDIPDGAR